MRSHPPAWLAWAPALFVVLWSTGFKNAAQFEEIWLQGSTYAEKMQATARHRDLMLAASPMAKLLEGTGQ